MATVHSLAYQPGPTDHDAPRGFNRVAAETVTLVANHGIDGDYKAGRNPKRQVNILSLETIQELAAEGWKIGPGELGEQIVISGLDVQALAPGARIRLGESAIVEITMLREPCGWLASHHGKDHEDVIGRMGVLGSVIEGGEVSVGSPVIVVSVPEGEA